MYLDTVKKLVRASQGGGEIQSRHIYLMTCDRAVLKIPAEAIAQTHVPLRFQ